MEDELSLFGRWRRSGDLVARRAIVESHLWLVRAIARTYGCSASEREDLVAEGALALFDACERFDPSRGTRFASYARPWVRSAMSAYLVRTKSATGARQAGRDLSLDAPLAEAPELTLLDALASSDEGAEAALEAADRRAAVRRTLAQARTVLEPRERVILDMGFGDGGNEVVAERLSLSKERVRQLTERLRVKLSRSLRELDAPR